MRRLPSLQPLSCPLSFSYLSILGYFTVKLPSRGLLLLLLQLKPLSHHPTYTNRSHRQASFPILPPLLSASHIPSRLLNFSAVFWLPPRTGWAQLCLFCFFLIVHRGKERGWGVGALTGVGGYMKKFKNKKKSNGIREGQMRCTLFAFIVTVWSQRASPPNGRVYRSWTPACSPVSIMEYHRHRGNDWLREQRCMMCSLAIFYFVNQLVDWLIQAKRTAGPRQTLHLPASSLLTTALLLLSRIG